jgi:hypothetical protein
MDAMRKANVNTSKLLEKRLAETNMSEHDRDHALNLMRDAEAIADAIVWVKEKIASVRGLFLKPGFKN